jgi:hypothetical protein
MNPIALRLIPAPGQKPEFLATLQALEASSFLEKTSPKLVVLENYTRDAWANETSTKWNKAQFQSIDGRNKVPGFVNYLRQRQKTAFGKFGSSHVIVIPPKQASSKTISCRIAPLENMSSSCPLKKTVIKKPQQPAKPPKQSAPAPANNKPKKKAFGLLGNLVGAQQRTNQQVITSKRKPAAASSSSTAGSSQYTGTKDENETPRKTCAQILMEFRQKMEQEMLDFDIVDEGSLMVKVNLAEKTRDLSDEEKLSGKITMEVLKYIVYEAAEEVNDEWIAHKEPSEFMDEVTIVVYKEGEAPDDVLEDMNKAELPEEVLGQQRALQQAAQRQNEARSAKILEQQRKLAMQQNTNQDDNFATLNTNKRDRRTIENIQSEINAGKRQRT